MNTTRIRFSLIIGLTLILSGTSLTAWALNCVQTPISGHACGILSSTSSSRAVDCVNVTCSGTGGTCIGPWPWYTPYAYAADSFVAIQYCDCVPSSSSAVYCLDTAENVCGTKSYYTNSTCSLKHANCSDKSYLTCGCTGTGC